MSVTEDLSVPGLPEVFAIGDTALSNGWNGKPVPGLAPAAKQQGRYVASVVKARIEGRPPPAPFHSATRVASRRSAGRRRSPISAGCGSPVLWLGNRVVVALEWFWAYLTYHPSTRLITSSDHSALDRGTGDSRSSFARVIGAIAWLL
jgi:NADH dehydrogenase FAD-containing subunit